jgi:hypothetical protein
MPKDVKKSKGKKVAATTAQTDDDFDDMLAEFCAADLSSLTPVRSSSTSSSGCSNAVTKPIDAGTGVSNNAARTSASESRHDASEDAFVQACAEGDMAFLRQWKRRGIKMLNSRPLLQAAGHGQLKVLRFLVEELGSDVNRIDSEKCTALYVAAQEGKLDAVRFLVEDLGANVNQANQHGETPLHVAAKMGHVTLVRCLAKELCADVNQGNREGVTALQMASQNGNIFFMRCLIEELGADINQAAKIDGVTALMLAANNSHHKIVAYLVRHGADPQTSAPAFGTAANISNQVGAPAEQTAYLESKMHCSHPGCGGAVLNVQ